MRTYEFSPEMNMAPIFTISISETTGKTNVVTRWRDLDGNFGKLHSANIPSETREFFQKLTNFWKNVCKFERKGNPATIEKIIEAVADPELKLFLNRNR